MKPLLALLILAAALFVGACNNPAGSAVPTLNPVPSTLTSPGTSPELSPQVSPAASPSA
jgi:hypothetical protein